MTTGRASSAGAVRWLGALARGVAVVLGTVLLVLLVPSEAWAATADPGVEGRLYLADYDVPLSGADEHQIAAGAVTVQHDSSTSGSAQLVVYCFRPTDPDPTVPTDASSSTAPLGYISGGTNTSQTWDDGSNGVVTSNPSLVTCPVASSPTEQTVPKILRVATTNSGDTPRYSWYSLGADPVSSCLDSWAGLWASADGTTIKVRFDWITEPLTLPNPDGPTSACLLRRRSEWR